jgi:hypothetical protein
MGVGETVPFWDTVVINLAPIIIALTGFGAMIGGFWMQKRMMDRQNEKIDRNAKKAEDDRSVINTKIDQVTANTNGIAQRNEAVAKALGVVEGRAQVAQEAKDREEHP